MAACSAAYGVGGLGAVFADAIEELRAHDRLATYFSPAPRANDPAGRRIDLSRHRWLFRATPLRRAFGRREAVWRWLFDRSVAQRLSAPDQAGAQFSGFAGEAQLGFARARALGYGRLVLQSPTSHVAHVWRRHQAALDAHPVEGSWLTRATLRRTIREYAAADEIVVLSSYAHDSFTREGIPRDKLRIRSPSPGPRFAPPARAIAHDGFRVLYVGRLQVTKGVCVLLDALSRIPDPDVRLVLHGGTATASMDAYLARQRETDPRITLSSGDPLPELYRCDLLVHPSYEDGFGLAPAEALATGVDVVVTEDTGMKDHVRPGENGLVVSSGDAGRLADAILQMRRQR